MQHAGVGRRLWCHGPLVLALAALLVAPAAGLTLTAQERSVGANGTVVVSVLVADAQDLGSLDLVVAYDPALLRFESAAPGSLAERHRVSASETEPGRIAVAIASPGSLTGTGPVLALTFTAVGAAGARTPVTLESVRAVTIDDESVPAQVENGTVSVGGAPRTPLSPLAAVGAFGIAAASLRRRRRGRSSRQPPGCRGEGVSAGLAE